MILDANKHILFVMLDVDGAVYYSMKITHYVTVVLPVRSKVTCIFN